MPKIKISHTDLTGSIQQSSISNNVFVPIEATEAFKPVLVTSIEQLEKDNAVAAAKIDTLGYKLAKHLIGLGLPVLLQGIERTDAGDVLMSAAEWEALTDKNLYDIRFLTYGGLTGERACQDMINVAYKRKDCVALVDLDESISNIDSYDVLKIRSRFEAAGLANGEFAAAFTPWFYSKNSDFSNTNIIFSEITASGSKPSNVCAKLTNATDANDVKSYVELIPDYTGRKPLVFEATFREDPVGSFVVKYNADSSKDLTVEIEGEEVTVHTAINYIELSQLGDNLSTEEKQYYASATRYTRVMNLVDQGNTHNISIPTSNEKYDYYFKSYHGEYKAYIEFQGAPFYQRIVNTSLEANDKGVLIPAAFGYLFAYANSIKNNPEWYAVAGFERGIIPELASVAHNYSSADIEILQARSRDQVVDLDDAADNVGLAINPIAYIRPAGDIIYGNRTMKINDAAKKTTATSFLNVRNLVSAITKVMYEGARKYTFEQNNDLLWLNFQAYVRPTLEKMKQGNGIADYSFVRETTNAKARLTAKLNIIPIEAVEDFDLTIVMTDDQTVIDG